MLNTLLLQHISNHAHHTARNGVGHLAVNLFAHAVGQIIGNALIGFFAAAEQSAEQAVYYAWFFGFFGLVAILALFTLLLMSLLRVAARLPDMGLRLLVVGVFGWVGSHVILNVAAMTGVAPLTGIPLPLLSYGGTSMLFIAASLGLAFQLSRYTSHKPIEEGALQNESSSSRRGIGRTRHASRSGL